MRGTDLSSGLRRERRSSGYYRLDTGLFHSANLYHTDPSVRSRQIHKQIPQDYQLEMLNGSTQHLVLDGYLGEAVRFRRGIANGE